ncbi:MAG: hypothetical protein O3B90_03105 [Actinomycetota bacterium]|uniref:hypothetical protein n=1 Tax=uncultured Ilumatobacter sp. TaxID=879968 RepID=UPI00374FB2E5|nr:hypothetical protein [Actinomycetota bacterium]
MSMTVDARYLPLMDGPAPTTSEFRRPFVTDLAEVADGVIAHLRQKAQSEEANIDQPKS